MKSIGYFVAAFLICGIVGFIEGNIDVHAPDYVQAISFSPVTMMMLKHGRMSVVELVYIENKQILYIFNVDSNSLERTQAGAAVDLTFRRGEFAQLLHFPFNNILVLAVIDGGGAGFILKDLTSALVEGSKQRQVISAVLGGISGFALGYKLGAGYPPNSHSKVVLDNLNDQKKWQWYKTIYLKKILFDAFQAAEMISDKKASEYYNTLAVELYDLADRSPDKVGSVEFILAADLFNKTVGTAKINVTNINKPVQSSWQSWWWIGLLIAIVLVAFGGVLAWERRSSRTTPVLRRRRTD